MSNKSLPTRVVDQMFNHDQFSKWLGIERLQDGTGISALRMTVRREMLNGFAVAHGGITYSFADSALAFASNSHGIQSLSIETSISHTKKIVEGEVLTARAIEKSLSSKIGVYEVIITNQRDETVALFKGTVFRTGKEWEV